MKPRSRCIVALKSSMTRTHSPKTPAISTATRRKRDGSTRGIGEVRTLCRLDVSIVCDRSRQEYPPHFRSCGNSHHCSRYLLSIRGSFESSSIGVVYCVSLTKLSHITSLDGAATILQGICFSIITLTTIGYGDLYLTGVGSKTLVGFESLSSAILITIVCVCA